MPRFGRKTRAEKQSARALRPPDWIEIHRFDDRFYVVGPRRWGHGPAPDATALGALVLQGLTRERSLQRPLIEEDTKVSRDRDEKDRLEWQRFRRSFTGSSDADTYQPEIRIQVLEQSDGLVGLKSFQASAELVEPEFVDPATGAAALGGAAFRLAAKLRPHWPTAGAASIDITSDFIVVQANVHTYLVPPFIRLAADATDLQLGEAIETAVSGGEPAREGHRVELELAFLKAVGVRRDAMDSLAHSGVRLDTHGTVTVAGAAWTERRGELNTVSTESLTSPAAETVGRAVRRALSAAAQARQGTQHPSGVGVAFGPKSAWLAIRGDDVDAVAGALRLRSRTQVSWRLGLEKLTAGGVFVSPPVAGWILAIDPRWIGQPPDIRGISQILNSEVQCFESHRVLEHHAWSRAIDGRMLRAFSYTGESGTCHSAGEPTEIERQLGVAEFEEAFRKGLDPPDRFPNEEDLLRVAGAWSIDPSGLGGADDHPIGMYGAVRD